MSLPQLSEVCLVANLQTMGPTFLAAAKGNIFDHGAGMLLAARIVITSGMGNSTTGLNKINGPIPISELNLEEDYIVYFFPMEMQQMPRPDNEFSTGRGTYIVCLIVPEEYKQPFRNLEETLEKALQPYAEKFDFSETISGEVPKSLQEDFSMILTEIMTDLNTVIDLSIQFDGGSLFDIGLLANLPDSLAAVGKKIMLHPKGILESQIEDKSALKTLYQTGLIEREERDDGVWVVPR